MTGLGMQAVIGNLRRVGLYTLGGSEARPRCIKLCVGSGSDSCSWKIILGWNFYPRAKGIDMRNNEKRVNGYAGK